nr:MAG TPA: hypothetical protein [Microviridae sp.]
MRRKIELSSRFLLSLVHKRTTHTPMVESKKNSFLLQL